MYTFDDKMHAHKLDGKPLHGVTTVLSVISKPALIPWASKMASEYIRENWDTAIPPFTDPVLWDKTLRDACNAHKRKKEKGGNWGHIVHKAIEDYLKHKKLPVLQGTQLAAFNNFRQWMTQENIEVIESEKHLYSKTLWLGGIVDLVFKRNGKKYIGDIKTSSQIYNEAFFQMGAYNLMLEEMGEHKDVEGYMVINLKKTGEIDFKLAENMQINKDAFLHALGLYKIVNALE